MTEEQCSYHHHYHRFSVCAHSACTASTNLGNIREKIRQLDTDQTQRSKITFATYSLNSLIRTSYILGQWYSYFAELTSNNI